MHPFTTGEIKKAATGNGGASKALMMSAAKVKLGRDPEDDNEADAVCLAYAALERYGIAGRV